MSWVCTEKIKPTTGSAGIEPNRERFFWMVENKMRIRGTNEHGSIWSLIELKNVSDIQSWL